MKLGQRMRRLEDGQRGVVAQNGPELRIVYVDRGEERMALKSEKWVPDEIRPGPLRDEEKLAVAIVADRALRAYEKNEPHKFWETLDQNAPAYDPGLVRLIVDYLTSRETLPANQN